MKNALGRCLGFVSLRTFTRCNSQLNWIQLSCFHYIFPFAQPTFFTEQMINFFDLIYRPMYVYPYIRGIDLTTHSYLCWEDSTRPRRRARATSFFNFLFETAVLTQKLVHLQLILAVIFVPWTKKYFQSIWFQFPTFPVAHSGSIRVTAAFFLFNIAAGWPDWANFRLLGD
jgi:hypothetical protein